MPLVSRERVRSHTSFAKAATKKKRKPFACQSRAHASPADGSSARLRGQLPAGVSKKKKPLWSSLPTLLPRTITVKFHPQQFRLVHPADFIQFPLTTPFIISQVSFPSAPHLVTSPLFLNSNQSFK